jgi:pilus biogenesis lipoprotein CpaD
MLRQSVSKLLVIDMKKVAILMSLVVVASCTSAIKPRENSSSYIAQSNVAPIDANSTFGELEIKEETLIVERNEFDAEKLLFVIQKHSKSTAYKQFFLIDLQSTAQSNAQEFSRIANDALKKTKLNYQIKVKPGNDAKNLESVLVRLRSIHIKPRDCSPSAPEPRQVLGSYYEAKFGCSYANNIAAMIDNPRDTLAPRGNAFLDTPRAMTVLRKYIDGEPTGALRPEGEAGEASEVSPSQ